MKTFTLVAVVLLSGLARANPPVCTTAPRSCGDWSAYYDVGATYCGWSRFCEGEQQPMIVRVTMQKEERFHMCVYSDGTQCIETQQTAETLSCGCF